MLGIIVLLTPQRISQACTSNLLVSDHQMAEPVLLDARVSDFDRKAYPGAVYVALINSDRPALTRELLSRIPQGRGGAIKLSTNENRDIVREKYLIERRTSYLSFTSVVLFPADDQVAVMLHPCAG